MTHRPKKLGSGHTSICIFWRNFILKFFYYIINNWFYLFNYSFLLINIDRTSNLSLINSLILFPHRAFTDRISESQDAHRNLKSNLILTKNVSKTGFSVQYTHRETVQCWYGLIVPLFEIIWLFFTSYVQPFLLFIVQFLCKNILYRQIACKFWSTTKIISLSFVFSKSKQAKIQIDQYFIYIKKLYDVEIFADRWKSYNLISNLFLFDICIFSLNNM